MQYEMRKKNRFLDMLFLGSVDAVNNLRDNKVNFHDIISTERWEMRFFGFFLINKNELHKLE